MVSDIRQKHVDHLEREAIGELWSLHITTSDDADEAWILASGTVFLDTGMHEVILHVPRSFPFKPPVFELIDVDGESSFYDIFASEWSPACMRLHVMMMTFIAFMNE